MKKLFDVGNSLHQMKVTFVGSQQTKSMPYLHTNINSIKVSLKSMQIGSFWQQKYVVTIEVIID